MGLLGSLSHDKNYPIKGFHNVLYAWYPFTYDTISKFLVTITLISFWSIIILATPIFLFSSSKSTIIFNLVNHLSESSYSKHWNLTFEFETQLDREANKSLFLIFIFFRHNVTFKTVVGESNSVQPETVASWFETTLPILQSNYKFEDIFNANESGLFYQSLPNKIFVLFWNASSISIQELKYLMMFGAVKSAELKFDIAKKVRQ